MALSLTSEELHKVAAKHKETKPVYYNAAQGAFVPVSNDFEAFLILSTVPKKKSAVDWINLLTIGLESDMIRDLIVTDYIAREAADVLTQKTLLEVLTMAYDSFRTDFADSRFNGVPEVMSLLADTQLGIDRLYTKVDDMQHRYIMCTAMQSRANSAAITESRKMQAESWVIPLMTPYI